MVPFRVPVIITAACGHVGRFALATVHTVSDAKREVLHAAGAFNPHAATVTDAAFVAHPFFDARDLGPGQVRDGAARRSRGAVTHAAAAFGFYRPAFYAAQVALARGGLPAPVRQRPGLGDGTSSARRLSPHCGRPVSTSR
jgi:hypothetical protein